MNSKDLSSSVIILKNITGAKIVKETHISYAVIGDEYVYKIKKPVDFGFLDYRLAKSRKMYSILEKDLKIGDFVVIQKAGDVIPEVVEVKKEKRTGEETPFQMPNICPVCGALAVREEGEAATRCIGIECPAKQYRNIIHFASREAMDIKGLGDSIIEELLNRNLIKNIADIYELTLEDVASLKKNGKKFASNLIESINDSKNNDLYRVITGLGIRNIGVKAAKSLAKNYKTIDNLMRSK